MKKVLAAHAVGLVGAFFLTAPAAAVEPTEDCKTVVTNLVDRPDSGTNGQWAKDTFTRTVKVCHVSEMTKLTVPVESWNYTATVVDKGTFLTLGGPNLSPGNNKKLLAEIPGTFEGGFTATFAAPANWQFYSDTHLQGKILSGPAGQGNPTSSEWVKSLWTSGFVGTSLNEDWKWTYTTCNEQWVNAASGNNGDITGKSWKACHAVVFKDKCDKVEITLKNNAPWPFAKALFRIGDDWYSGHINGGVAKTVTWDDIDGEIKVYARIDGKWELLATHTWVKPESCTPPVSESPSPSPTTVEPTPSSSSTMVVPPAPAPGGGLPVTGSKVAVIAGAGTLLAALGVALLIASHKRREDDQNELMAD